MKIVYIAHPIGPVNPVDYLDAQRQIKTNIAGLQRIIKLINTNTTEVVPFVPYVADVLSLDDTNPQHRARGLRNGLEVIQRGGFDELWLTGPQVSKRMHAEAITAASIGKPVVNLTKVNLLAWLKNFNY